jgi:hypothetical protein
MTQPQTITRSYKLFELPTMKVEAIDWDAVYARLANGEEPVFACTVPQARLFNMWAQRHKSVAVYYRTEGEGHLKFSLNPFRANARSKPAAKRGSKRK